MSEHNHDSHGHDSHGHDSHGHDSHGHDSHGHDAHGHGSGPLLSPVFLLLLAGALAVVGLGISAGVKHRAPLYLIPLLPLLGAAANLLVGRKLSRTAVHALGCGAALGSLGVVLGSVFGKLYPLWKQAGGYAATTVPNVHNQLFDWIVAGPVSIKAALILDPLSAVMVITVTFVGSLIHIYATGYMAHDKDYARFFGYLNLFTGSMLILVLGDSLLTLFVGWEGVGVCSYLLIGFWYNKSGTEAPGDENATAGKKAFIVNRIGDFAFVLGMFLIFSHTGTLVVSELAQKTEALSGTMNLLGMGTFTVAGVAAVLLLIGATGKSAQIPLYVWLPDAMAGPTPVSALIHAATMVTAGVYMVARLNFLFMLSPFAMGLVALVGAVTALFAATIGLCQNDIKKVLAYSTVSQLGYMFMGVGMGAFAAGVFHLFTHAFFKACLFLGAGAVIHAMSGKQDIREMGGLAKKMPITRMTFLVSCLAIAGIPIFAGFFSKDEILWKAISTQNPAWGGAFPYLIYVLGLAAAMCTAFYMFRLYWLTFGGENRADEHTRAHIHEQPWNMTMPLAVLATGATVLGFLGLPGLLGAHANVFHNWLAPVVDMGHRAAAAAPEVPAVRAGALAHSHGAEAGLMVLSVLVALGSILLARKWYQNGPSEQAADLAERFKGVHALIYDKYRIDELYFAVVVKPLRWFSMVLARGVDWVIDVIGVNGSAEVVGWIGDKTRRIQNGNAQRYVIGLVVGVAVVAFFTTLPPDDFVVEGGGGDGKALTAGQKVTFDAARKFKADGRKLVYRWDFDGDGKVDHPAEGWSNTARVTHTYAGAGTYEVTLHVWDQRWLTQASESATVEVK